MSEVSVNTSPEIVLQRQYYARTADSYDTTHDEAEHLIALHVLAAFVALHRVTSILDIGAGTGRAMAWLKARFPELKVKGLEPVLELREQAYAKGISPNDLQEGRGEAIPYDDNSFDLVCAFAVMHHVPRPDLIVAEMSRVASKLAVISDANFMGQGPKPLKLVKLALYSVGLWPLANWVKTRGKGYIYSEGDGISYSYSVFQNLQQFRRLWGNVLAFPVIAGSNTVSLRLGASHVLLIGSEKSSQSPSLPDHGL